jgi:hypothetical protein
VTSGEILDAWMQVFLLTIAPAMVFVAVINVILLLREGFYVLMNRMRSDE